MGAMQVRKMLRSRRRSAHLRKEDLRVQDPWGAEVPKRWGTSTVTAIPIDSRQTVCIDCRKGRLSVRGVKVCGK